MPSRAVARGRTHRPRARHRAAAAPPLPGLFSIGVRQWMVLLTVQMSTLLFGMTITLANVVLPQIRGSLSATQDEISWVITLNLVATAVATPMTGWLASRLGWRNVMFYSVLGFTVSSFLCGIADSLETLVLYRVGQGLFGATIMPMGQGIVLATFPAPPAHRGDGDLGRRQRHGSGVRPDLRQRHGREPTTGAPPSS